MNPILAVVVPGLARSLTVAVRWRRVVAGCEGGACGLRRGRGRGVRGRGGTGGDAGCKWLKGKGKGSSQFSIAFIKRFERQTGGSAPILDESKRRVRA